MKNWISKIALSGLCASFLMSTNVSAQDGYYNQWSTSCDQSCVPVYYDDCSCSCPNRFWVGVDYLYWQIKNSPKTIPLVITGPTTNPFPVLGDAGTSIVLGNKSIKNDWRSGVKVNLGYWFDDNSCYGLEANYFILPNQKKSSSVFSSGLPDSPFLGIPYINANTLQEAVAAVASSAEGIPPFSGYAELKDKNRMQGAELNVLAKLYTDCSWKVNGLAGFRYWNFQERLSFFTSSPFINIPNNLFETTDKFETENNFYGGQIGIALDYICNNFFFNARGKVALGAMCGKVDIHGQLVTNDFTVGLNGPVQTFEGGFFAQPTNIGNHKHTRFSVIPEVGFNVGYQIMDCLSIQAGYTFLYVSNVLWASKQMERTVNPTQVVALSNTGQAQLVGPAEPTAPLKTDSLWAQGLNVGINYRF